MDHLQTPRTQPVELSCKGPADCLPCAPDRIYSKSRSYRFCFNAVKPIELLPKQVFLP